MLESESVMKKFSFGIFILIVLFSGCSWFGSKHSSRKINPDDLVVKLENKETVLSMGALTDSNILDLQKFKKGGNIIVIPFSPGANIEANDEFDRITLRMIRGIVDELEKETSRFVFISSENTDEADFIIEGRVTEIQKPSMMKSVTFKNNHRRISVQGKLLDRETEKTVAVFSDTVEAKDKRETLEILGTKIGHHIGHLLTADR